MYYVFFSDVSYMFCIDFFKGLPIRPWALGPPVEDMAQAPTCSSMSLRLRNVGIVLGALLCSRGNLNGVRMFVNGLFVNGS